MFIVNLYGFKWTCNNMLSSEQGSDTAHVMLVTTKSSMCYFLDGIKVKDKQNKPNPDFTGQVVTAIFCPFRGHWIEELTQLQPLLADPQSLPSPCRKTEGFPLLRPKFCLQGVVKLPQGDFVNNFVSSQID